MEWQWHQLLVSWSLTSLFSTNMAISETSGISWTICESFAPWLYTDNHASTSSLNFYGPDALPDTQPKA